jgi:hypothetical protein
MARKGSAHLLHLRSFTIACDFILMPTKITKCTQEKVYGSKVGSVCQCLFVPEWQVTVTNVLVGKILPVK